MTSDENDVVEDISIENIVSDYSDTEDGFDTSDVISEITKFDEDMFEENKDLPTDVFTPKEIYSSIFGGALSIYVSGLSAKEKINPKDAVKISSEIFSYCSNRDSINDIFKSVTLDNEFSYDVLSEARFIEAKAIEIAKKNKEKDESSD